MNERLGKFQGWLAVIWGSSGNNCLELWSLWLEIYINGNCAPNVALGFERWQSFVFIGTVTAGSVIVHTCCCLISGLSVWYSVFCFMNWCCAFTAAMLISSVPFHFCAAQMLAHEREFTEEKLLSHRIREPQNCWCLLTDTQCAGRAVYIFGELEHLWQLLCQLE